MSEKSTYSIIQMNSLSPSQLDDLCRLLISVVEDGASLGFLPPLSYDEAEQYWRYVLEPGVMLWAALLDGKVIGTVQLQLAMKRNALHRAEIAKLMVDPAARRSGIARALMTAAHTAAEHEGRTLLVLDTREGDPSNKLYLSLGYKEGGRIPQFARSSTGSLDATVIYYLQLQSQ